jgi:hypothetical protein
MIETTLLQTTGPSQGDILNLIGIGILLVAGYHYIQYRQTSQTVEREESRKRFTAAVLVFAFYAIVAYLYFEQADSWVIQVGESVNLYFARMSESLIVDAQTRGSTTTVDTVLEGVRTVGLIVYVVLFAATSILAKAPLIVLDRLT